MNADDNRLANFVELTESEKRAAIRRMAREGFADHSIAHATGLSVEMVRAILGPRKR